MANRAAPEKYNLESVARTVAILRAVEAAEGGTLDQIAHAAELSESTALRYLSSLATHDLIERDPVTGVYRLGLSLFRLGSAAIAQRDISSLATPVLDRLRDRFGETVNVAARQADQVVVIQVREGQRPVRKGVAAGGTDAWHSTSLGKALLAALPQEKVEQVLARFELTRFTPNTLTTAQDLMRDIAAVKTRGYSIDDEESDEGLRCVGVAVRDHGGAPNYALSVSGPKSRMPYARIQEIGETLVVEAAELSGLLGHRA